MPSSISLQKRQAEFENLFSESYVSAYRLAYRLTGNRLDAEDLTMEAYHRAWVAFDRYDSNYPFLAWLLRILSNLAVDRWRSQKYKVVSWEQINPNNEMEFALVETSSTAEGKVLVQSIIEDVQLVLCQLSKPYRIAISLVDIEGYSYQEVADRMHCSIGTVRSRLYRGRRLFQEAWKKLHGEVPVYFSN